MAPGLLYAVTTIDSPLLEESTFHKWYDLHIAELIAVEGGPSVGYRYQNVDRLHQKWHFLAIYPLEDIAFTRTPEVSKNFTYMLPEGKSILELIRFEGRDYDFIGDEGTAINIEEKPKWIITAEIDVGDGDGTAQKVDSVLNERVEGVRTSRYRINRAPTAINGLDVPEFPVPRELVIYSTNQKEDIDRAARELEQKLQGVGASVKLSTWEAK